MSTRDFIARTADRLGAPVSVVRAATRNLLLVLRQHVAAEDFRELLDRMAGFGDLLVDESALEDAIDGDADAATASPLERALQRSGLDPALNAQFLSAFFAFVKHGAGMSVMFRLIRALPAIADIMDRQ